MFVCPSCKTSFNDFDKNLKSIKCLNTNCSFNKKPFQIIDRIPILIPFDSQDCIFEESNLSSLNLGSNCRKVNKKINLLEKFLRKIFVGENKISRKNFDFLQNKLQENTKILIIGGGIVGSGMSSFYKKCAKLNIKLEAIDVYISENINAVVDAHYLPYANETFDIVIIQAVLEHVLNPQRVVKEIFRVLKLNGIVYSETPFMQSVHEGPYDFTRFSHSGHRWLFRKFDEIYSGVNHGAFTSALFVLSYALAGLFRSRFIGKILRLLFHKSAYFLDQITPQKFNIDVASGCYFMGYKSLTNKNNRSSSWIIKYYLGAQK